MVRVSMEFQVYTLWLHVGKDFLVTPLACPTPNAHNAKKYDDYYASTDDIVYESKMDTWTGLNLAQVVTTFNWLKLCYQNMLIS